MQIRSLDRFVRFADRADDAARWHVLVRLDGDLVHSTFADHEDAAGVAAQIQLAYCQQADLSGSMLRTELRKVKAGKIAKRASRIEEIRLGVVS